MMQDKPLELADSALLEVILQLHADKGPFQRNTLTVMGRGRGLEVARPLGRLKSLGLVEEYEYRPFFLKRLFGARTTQLLRPTALALARTATTAGTAAVSPAAEAQAEATAPVDLPPVQGGMAAASAAPVFDAPRAFEAAADAPAPAAPEAPAAAETPADQPVPDQTAADQTAPDLPPVPPEAPAAAPISVVSAAVARVRPPRLPPDAYTDEIGGQPQAVAPMASTLSISPELLEDLREMLAVLGMEMTMAGEGLISDRIAKGASAGEGLMQVTLYAFAHAAHYDMMFDSPVPAQDLQDYAVEVIRELEKLREAGEIGAGAFARDMRWILLLADRSADRAPLVADLLADPIGGAAPPAMLPEELRGVEDTDGDE